MKGPSRRGLLTGGAAGAVGLAAGGLLGAGVNRPEPDPALAVTLSRGGYRDGLPPALLTPTPSHVRVVVLDVVAGGPEEVAARAGEVAQAWREEIRALHEHGLEGVVEGAPTQGLHPASLGITLGLGGSLLERAGLGDRRPEELEDLPDFAGDRLREEWCDGDLMLHVGAEDPVVAGAAARHLVDLVGGRVRVRWALPGFRRGAVTAKDPSATPRNLMGQVDGTVNPHPDQAVFASQVLAAHPDPATAWMDGGTYVVVRRIRMLLEGWFALSEDEREQVVGRRLDDGAPLGGSKEDDRPNLVARDDAGRQVIAPNAHIRLASAENTLGARMLRRGFDYDLGWDSEGRVDAGLLFTAWQADPRTGFTAVQRSLDEGGDALGEYIRHEGGAVFAVPPVRDEGQVPGPELWG